MTDKILQKQYDQAQQYFSNFRFDCVRDIIESINITKDDINTFNKKFEENNWEPLAKTHFQNILTFWSLIESCKFIEIEKSKKSILNKDGYKKGDILFANQILDAGSNLISFYEVIRTTTKTIILATLDSKRLNDKDDPNKSKVFPSKKYLPLPFKKVYTKNLLLNDIKLELYKDQNLIEDQTFINSCLENCEDPQ